MAGVIVVNMEVSAAESGHRTPSRHNTKILHFLPLTFVLQRDGAKHTECRQSAANGQGHAQ